MTEWQKRIDEKLRMYKAADKNLLKLYIAGYHESIKELLAEQAWLETCVRMAEDELSQRS